MVTIENLWRDSSGNMVRMVSTSLIICILICSKIECYSCMIVSLPACLSGWMAVGSTFLRRPSTWLHESSTERFAENI